MRQLNTREKVMVGGLAVAAIIAWFGAREGGMGFGDSVAGPGALPPLAGDPPEVHVDLLAMDPVGYDPNGRNLFAYYTPPPPPRKAAPRRPPPPPPPPPPERKDPVVRREVNREPQPPSPDFHYVGYLGPKDDRIAVFTAGEELFVSKIGEIAKGQFVLEEFRYETVVFSFVDERFKGKTTELKLQSTE
jgi:hypothetical protein